MKLNWEKSTKPATDRPAAIIKNMAYDRYDHVYLYAALKTIDDGQASAPDVFAKGYKSKLKAAGLIHHEGNGDIQLTERGQATMKYMDEHKAIIGQDNIRFFGQTHLRASLNNGAWKKGHTQRYFAEAGYLQAGGDKLSQKGISARSYLNVLEDAKWKRAGKPNPARALS